MSFAVRGVVEGFYGPPWSHDDRAALVEHIGAHGMNAYVYAPKDEPKHRAAWRDPYDDEDRARFAELARRGAEAGVRVGFAISPGLDIDYDAADDRAALLEKCRVMLDTGIGWFLLALDDIPMRDGLAGAQAKVANELLDALRAESPGVELCLCPTEYLGVRPSAYLRSLATDLAPDIDVVWTGPTVCSPRIAADDAASWRAALGGHGLLLWDNVPVNDGSMATRLHLGPYEGRDPALAGELRGVLLNPMNQARASLVTVTAAARFLAAPETYDADAAWADAIASVDAGARLAPLARACADGPMRPPERLALHELVEALAVELDGPGWIAALSAVADELRAARAAADALRHDADAGDLLALEALPWAAQLRIEADAALAAARLVQHALPVAQFVSDGSARAVGVDHDALLNRSFAAVGAWSAARRTPPDHVVFGPRFAVYPAIVATRDGVPSLDAARAVIEDANAVDALCRLALELADDARVRDGSVRAFVDGEERPVDADGTFDGRGAMVLLREARAATRIGPDTALPFRDARLR